MSMNNTPMSERLHIGLFGRRNAGKSSVINALTGQNLSIVSEVKGTTTDPVLKSMELLPLGPVVIIDTPGLDDEGKLGSLRIQKAYQMLNKTDIALLVVDATVGMTKEDEEILLKIREKKIPYLVVFNKTDLAGEFEPAIKEEISWIAVSAATKENIHPLKERIGQLIPAGDSSKKIVGDLIKPMDFVVLVVPIDKAAPKGRLILPQQQTIRDILDAGAVPIVTRDTELSDTLKKLNQDPALVITDSQAFSKVSKIVLDNVPLTSFSVLFARYKGDLDALANGAKTLDHLKDGDVILISEGCTHHRQCGDIGTEKLPAWIKKHTGKQLTFAFTSGTEFPSDLSGYSLIIHCGGCMLNEREMKYRMNCAKDAHVPITNYGTAIAHMNGILERSTRMF